MCREALDGYLRDETGVDQGTLNALRQEAVGSRDEHQPLPNIPADALIDALEKVRVCDPAVGSGAFLLGAIQEIVALRRGILFSQRSYVEPHEFYQTVSDWKRRTIENSLYGVDINPEAVEICRLRLWLSMVLDMDDPPEPNSDWALPNLDFQIVAGDSLVDRVAGVTFKESWPTPKSLQLGMELQGSLQRLETNIAQRRREFERTHRNPIRLRELRDLIARDQREIVRLHLVDALEKVEANLKALNKGKKPTKSALSRAQSLIVRINSSASQCRILRLRPSAEAIPLARRLPRCFAGRRPQRRLRRIVLANPPYVRHGEARQRGRAVLRARPSHEVACFYERTFSFTSMLALCRCSGPAAGCPSSPAISSCELGTEPESVSTFRLPCASSVSSTSATCPCLRPAARPIAAYPAVLVGNRSDDSAGRVLTVADLAGPIRKELSKANLKSQRRERARCARGHCMAC